MRQPSALLIVAACLSSAALSAEEPDGPKVFISVDMEGITGVVDWEETSRTGKDYDYFREVMTREANAAVEGAFATGASVVVVRDSHGSARNILPELLDRRALLIRDWSGGPKSMMEGIDSSFDAAIFIGYHAKAGTPDALLEHTSSGNVVDFSVNGVSMPEAGYNALIAGSFGVPVVFVAGDRALCSQITDLIPEVVTVAVKEGIGSAALNLHPEVARQKIREGVELALGDLAKHRPFHLEPPYTLVVNLKDEEVAHRGSFFPGATRTGEWELSYTSENLIDIMNAFSFMRR